MQQSYKLPYDNRTKGSNPFPAECILIKHIRVTRVRPLCSWIAYTDPMPMLLLKPKWHPESIIIQATSNDIELLKTSLPLFAEEKRVAKLSEKFYHLSPPATKSVAPCLYEVVMVRDLDLTKESVRTEEIDDFEDSIKFYKFIAVNKIKIVEDNYSFIKNQLLYKAFYLIESQLRIVAMSKDEIMQHVPANPRNKGINHKVATFNFSELYEQLLMSPASDEYIIKKWKGYSSDPVELLKLKSETTKIEELEFPLNIDELNELRKIRNSCMHFRVTTLGDYVSAISMINRYLVDRDKKMLARGLGQALRPFQDALKVSEDRLKALGEEQRNILRVLSGQ